MRRGIGNSAGEGTIFCCYQNRPGREIWAREPRGLHRASAVEISSQGQPQKRTGRVLNHCVSNWAWVSATHGSEKGEASFARAKSLSNKRLAQEHTMRSTMTI